MSCIDALPCSRDEAVWARKSYKQFLRVPNIPRPLNCLDGGSLYEENKTIKSIQWFLFTLKINLTSFGNNLALEYQYYLAFAYVLVNWYTYPYSICLGFANLSSLQVEHDALLL